MLRRTRPQLLCVYRQRNAALVEDLVRQVRRMGGSSYLWALDEPHPALQPSTVGTGPGQRLVLLNRLLAHAAAGQPLVVCDDDISFARGDLAALLRTVRRGGLDLAQPGHAPGSHTSHWITQAVPGSIARRTRFVEVGPLVVVSPRIRPAMTPFPEAYGMGWALDVVWSDLVDAGYRLGVVDRVSIVHHGAVGAAYDSAAGEEALARELAVRGLADMDPLNVELGWWRVRNRFDPRHWLPVWQTPPSYRDTAGG